MSYLLDTNVISELVKPAPHPLVLKWIENVNAEDLYLSVITIGEITKGLAGIENPHRKEKISAWLDIELMNYFENRILNIDIKIASNWGKLQSKKKGYVMPAIDGLIAATALAHNLKLVTRNKKDFVHASVEVINPWEFE